jgi:cysteinyl-tRNA synthetase
LGNVVLVHDLLKEWDGEVIRLALLKAHYRNELVWSEDLLRESKAQLDGWYKFIQATSDIKAESAVAWLKQNNLFEDLATATAIWRMGVFVAQGNKAIHLMDAVEGGHDFTDEQLASIDTEYGVEVPYSKGDLLLFGGWLGLLQRDPEEWFRGNAPADDSAEFDALAAARHAARQAKDWAEADRIRDEGAARGIIFEDSADGTTWRKA